ncbi:MAG: hypothetical protein GY696_12425, partial [Gammaproteobacteria bacterium]|nr:hypothetical protein [Gammaproteobacteria bacterium]
MVSVTGSGGTNFLSLTRRTIIGDLMPSGRSRTPDLLRESYAALKKPIQDLLPALDELLQNPLDPDGKPRHIHGRDLRDNLKKWIDELQGVQSELEDVLDRDLADTENKEERVERTELLVEVIRSHHKFLWGPESLLIDLEILMDEFQETMDMEKAKALRYEQFRREANERERIRQENRMNEDRRAAQKRAQELEDAAKKRTRYLEDVETRRKERRKEAESKEAARQEERKREMAIQLSAQ